MKRLINWLNNPEHLCLLWFYMMLFLWVIMMFTGFVIESRTESRGLEPL